MSFGSDLSPFSPDVQEKVKIKVSDQRKELYGKMCLAFEYIQEFKEGLVIGVAWLNEETGAPVELQSSPDPLPKQIKKMITTVRYEFGDKETL